MDDCVKTVLVISILDFLFMLFLSIMVLGFIYRESRIIAGLFVPVLATMNALFFRVEFEQGLEECDEQKY